MEIVVSNEQGTKPVTVFQVIGMVNRGSTDQLEQKANEALAGGMQYLLIDLSQTNSLTSAGLRSLQIIHEMMADKWPSAGIDAPGQSSVYLKILNPKPDIRRVLTISGFDRYFEVFEDRQEAILSF